MSDWTTTAASWVLTYLVQSTVLLLAAALLARWMTSPQARERLWKWALVGAIPVSLLTTWRAAEPDATRWELAPRVAWSAAQVEPAVEITSSPIGASETTHDAASEPTVVAGTPVAAPTPAPEPPATVASRSPSPAASTSVSWPHILVGVVAAFGIALFVRRGLAWFGLLRHLRDRRPVRHGSLLGLVDRLAREGELTSIVRLSIHDDLDTPVVLSTREVCLPQRVVEELDTATLEAVLAHELAHIRRRDTVWLWVCTLLETLLFLQPLNRVARRGLLDATEELCDDWAAQRTGHPEQLAQGLATVAGWVGNSRRAIPRPCLGEERQPLLRRVERLLNVDGRAGRFGAGAASAAMLLALIIACGTPAVYVQDWRVERPQLEQLDVAELIALGEQLSNLAGSRLLALPDGYEELHAEALAQPGTGAARLLRSGRFNVHPKREGGAYFSFELQDHDYNRWPDIALDASGEWLSSGFYGYMDGHVLDLGRVPLHDVTADAPPPGLVDMDRAAFEIMVDPLDPGVEPRHGLMRDRLDPIFAGDRMRRSGLARLRVGHTFLVRAFYPGERDSLAAMTITDEDEFGISMLWRLLKSWTPEDSLPSFEEQPFRLDDVPAWASDLEMTELFALQTELSDVTEARLLEVPAALLAEHGARFHGDGAGITRLASRGTLEHALAGRGMCYYGFVTESHDFQADVDIRLEQGRFGTGFSGGNTGIFVDLEDRPIESVSAGPAPEGLASPSAEAWAVAWTPLDSVTVPGLEEWSERARRLYGEPTDAEHDAQYEALTHEEYLRWWSNLQSRANDVAARLGHTYLLRSVWDQNHDVLVAFEVLGQDEYGVFLGWRLLERFY